jgi:hypothetical protein
MGKHSTGQWFAIKLESVTLIVDSNGDHVSNLRHPGWGDDPNAREKPQAMVDADARLSAAAPTLLAALTVMVAAMDAGDGCPDDDRTTFARNAIAMAKGEG